VVTGGGSVKDEGLGCWGHTGGYLCGALRYEAEGAPRIGGISYHYVNDTNEEELVLDCHARLLSSGIEGF